VAKLRLTLMRVLAFGLFFLLCLHIPANAAVTISFYSHKLRLIDGINTDFPHGFVLLNGVTSDGRPVHANLGFSATNIFINVLWEKVDGSLDPPLPASYVAAAREHFSFLLSDEQYAAVLAVADSWRNAPQPSYDMDDHNCVIFVKELAAAAGLAVSDDVKFIHAPGDFLDDVARRNADFLTRNGIRPPGWSMPDGVSAPSLEQRVRELEQAASRARP
jgi:hypothetical protein